MQITKTVLLKGRRSRHFSLVGTSQKSLLLFQKSNSSKKSKDCVDLFMENYIKTLNWSPVILETNKTNST